MSDHSVVFVKHCFSCPPSLLAPPCSRAEANAKAGASAATGASSEARQGLDKRAAIFSMLNCKAKLDTQTSPPELFRELPGLVFPSDDDHEL